VVPGWAVAIAGIAPTYTADSQFFLACYFTRDVEM